MAYDSLREVTVLFGGLAGYYYYKADTWEWNGTNWTDVSPAGVEGTDYPKARTGHSMAYDAERGVVVLFGGYDSSDQRRCDTWTWNGTNWSNVSPGGTEGVNFPSRRSCAAVAYDSTRKRIVLFGGDSNTGYLNDTWEWDGTNWTQKFPSNKPSVRYGHVMAFDSREGAVVLYGGGWYDAVSGYHTYDDTWRWDGSSWTEVVLPSKPPAKIFHAGCYDTRREKFVVYGGHDDTGLNQSDTWEYGVFPLEAKYDWTRRIGGSSWDSGYPAICADSEGNVYVGMSFYSPILNFAADWGGVDNRTRVGMCDVAVVKINADGSYAWTKQIAGPEEETAYDITTDAAGNVYVVCWFEGTINFAADWGGTDAKTSAGAGDISITKINADGSYGWTKRFGGTGEEGAAVYADSAGNLYLTGSFENTVNFAQDWGGSDFRTSKGGRDGFLIKINADGSYGWVKHFGGVEWGDGGIGITMDDAGNLYISGGFSANVNFAEDWGGNDIRTSNGDQDIFVMRVNADGSYGWVRTAGGTGHDQGLGICVGVDGNVYVSGWFKYTVNFAADWGGNDVKVYAGGAFGDGFVMNLKTDGSYGWTKRFGGAGTDLARKVWLDNFGNIVVAGFFARGGGSTVNFAEDWGLSDVKTSKGSDEVFLMGLYPNGSYGWTKRIGGTAEDSLSGMCIDSNDNIYLVGFFLSPTVNFAEDWGGTDIKALAGLSDTFVTKIARQ